MLFRHMRHLQALVGLAIFAASSSGLSTVKSHLRESRLATPAPSNQTPLYLPEAKYLRTISFGFEGFLGDILWFNTLNYFGKQIASGQDLRWFGHMCSLVTDLKPKTLQFYEFCGTLLSWVAKDATKSNAILQHGIEQFPDNWRLQYFLGFNTWYFLEDRVRAAEILRKAAEQPEAPPFLASLASRLLASEQDPALAVQFLTEVLRNTKDPTARSQLIDRLRRARLSEDLATLVKARQIFEERNGRVLDNVEELLSSGIIAGLQHDPFGGSYIYDKQRRAFASSTGERGLEFHRKLSSDRGEKQEPSESK